MTKRFIVILAAASMAFTAFTAAPARALDSGELGRLILGTGAVLLLGAAINEQKHKRNRTVPVQRRNVIQVPAHCVHGHGHNRWVDWNCAKRYGH